MSDVKLFPNIDENIKQVTKEDWSPKILKDALLTTLSRTNDSIVPANLPRYEDSDVKKTLYEGKKENDDIQTIEVINQYAKYGDAEKSSPLMNNLDKGFVTAIKAADTILSTSGSAASAAKFAMSPIIKAKKKALGIFFGQKAVSNLRGRYDSLSLTHTQDYDDGIYGKEIDYSAPAVASRALLGNASSQASMELSDVAKDFLEWATHKTKKGAAFNNIFDVTISDAEGVTVEYPGTANKNEEAIKTDIRFACTSVAVGGVSLVVDKTCLGLPLPVTGNVISDIKINIQDYNFRNMYQYFYNWYLAFYDPHKRRFVNGIKGKYKNIQIDVYTLGGVVDPDALDKTQYYRTQSITGVNCMMTDLPGQTFDYSDPKPSSFQVVLTPVDTYIDFTGDPNPANKVLSTANEYFDTDYR